MRFFTFMAVGAMLGACSSGLPGYERALERPTPPDDFWLGVSVLGPARSTGYAHLPRAQRPARYVVEADRVLRAAVGPGAGENVFPPRLRPLTDEQWSGLWETVRTSTLARGMAHEVSTVPGLEDAPERTVIVISYVAAGARRSIRVDLAGEDAQAGAEAMKIADAMAELAWLPAEP